MSQIPISSTCSLSWDSTDYVGWTTFIEWMMVASRKSSCMGNSLRASIQSAIPICASDVVKRDLVDIKINTNSWEQVPDNQVKWRATGSEARWHELTAEMRHMRSKRTA